MSGPRTLGDLKKREEEESKRNEYFAGGLDQRGGGSGLAVLGPPTNREGGPANRNVLDSIVEKATQHAEESPSENRDSAQGIEISLYRNGFTVNDGPLRDLTSAHNREFLTSLERGEVPRELLQKSPVNGAGIDVKLRDNRSEDYTPPRAPAYVAFSGTATTLGVAGANGMVFTAEVLRAVSPVVAVGEVQTTVQVRTRDNKRLKIKVGTSATVLQLAALIQREVGDGVAFTLSGGYPPKDLVDGMQTVAEAGLVGAALTMKNA